MRIYYEIETKRRELDARIFFSVIGASKGLSVVLGKKNRLISKINFFKPGIFIFKSSQNRAIKDGENFKNKKYIIYTSDEEGLINISEDEVLFRIPKKIFEITDRFISWGKEQTDILNKNYENISDKIITAGNSRFDILRNPINQIFNTEAKKIKKKYGEFDLYISAFHKYNAISYPGTDWFTGSKFHSEKRKQLFFNMFKAQEKNMNETINFFNNNVDKTSRKIIFRPHPSENISTWTEKLHPKLKQNVIYDDLNTNSWILAAKRIYSYYSTSLIEGIILGKKSINLIFFDKNVYDTKIFDICDKIVNPKDFKDLESKINNSENSLEDLRKKLNKYTEFQNLFSSEIICDDILKKYSNKFDETKKDKYTNKFYFLFFKYIQKIKNFIFVSKKDTLVQISLQKNPGIGLEEVSKKVSEISNLLNISDIRCKEIYPGIFEIKKI